MTYPVSPPDFPPVIRVVQPGDEKNDLPSAALVSSAEADSFPHEPESVREVRAASIQSASPTFTPTLTETRVPETADTGAIAPSANASVQGSMQRVSGTEPTQSSPAASFAAVESAIAVTSKAEGLGAPVEIGVPLVPTALSSFQYQAPLPSPDASHSPPAPAPVIPTAQRDEPVDIPVIEAGSESSDPALPENSNPPPARLTPVSELDLLVQQMRLGNQLSDEDAVEIEDLALPLDGLMDEVAAGVMTSAQEAEQEAIAPDPAISPLPSTAPMGGEVLVIPEAGDEPAVPLVEPIPDAVPNLLDHESENPLAGGSDTPPSGGLPPIDPSGTGEVVELDADRQEYDEQRRVFIAEGNVEMRFRGSVLTADRLQVNLLNRIAVAEGNVRLDRGEQLLEGDRFEYNFVQQEGSVLNARGEIFIPSGGRDFSGEPILEPGTSEDEPLTEELAEGQPNVVSGRDGAEVVLGSEESGLEGEVNRLRFEAEQIDFTATGWEAQNIRITNDPFSPPELELRADRATYTRLDEDRAEIRASRPRLVFDQGFSVPLLRSSVIIDNRERNPPLLQFGFDEEDRGGLFVEAPLDLIATNRVSLSVRPQFFIQRTFDEGLGARSLGVIGDLEVILGPQTTFEANAILTSLDLTNLEEDELRARVALQQRLWRHILTTEFTYNERFFNGSLGFENVESSIGFVLTSPNYRLGTSGIDLNYQFGIQNITATTDRNDLLPPPRERNGREINLTRYQGAVELGRRFTLWQGVGLPPTPTEGLRYTSSPVVPYLGLNTGLEGIANFYSSGDQQLSLIGEISLQGQFGHFSKPAFDYFGFEIGLERTFTDGESPFRFDREVDPIVLNAGILFQVYGPFRAGIETEIDLDDGDEISTDYILEYSRRAYGIVLEFNPIRERGSLTLRISDFNWTGETDPFGLP